MKKFLLSIVILTTAIFCTGCVQFSYDIEVNKKDKIDLTKTRSFKYRPLQSKEFKESVTKDFENIKENYKKRGFELVTDFQDNGLTTLKLKKQNLSGVEASKLLSKEFDIDNDNCLIINRNLIKKYYKMHLVYKQDNEMKLLNYDANKFKAESNTFKTYNNVLRRIAISISETRDNMGRAYITTVYADGNNTASKDKSIMNEQLKPLDFQSTLTIRIPVKAKSTNATKIIDNKTYQWDLTENNGNVDILLEYERWDFSNLITLISLIIIVGAAIYLSKKLNSENPVKGL